MGLGTKTIPGDGGHRGDGNALAPPALPPRPDYPDRRLTMWQDTTDLYKAAHVWEWRISDGLSRAASLVAGGEGSTALFGRALESCAAAHEEFVGNAIDQLRRGSAITEEMGVTLRRVTDDWVRTDEGVAESSDRLRRNT